MSINFKKIKDIYSFKLSDKNIVRVKETGYIYANDLTKPVNKRVDIWKNLINTQSLLRKLVTQHKMDEKTIIQSTTRGTWIHFDLGADLAKWCNPAYETQIKKMIEIVKENENENESEDESGEEEDEVETGVVSNNRLAGNGLISLALKEENLDHVKLAELAGYTPTEIEMIKMFWDTAFNDGWLYVSYEMVHNLLGYQECKNIMSNFYQKLVDLFQENIDYCQVINDHPLVKMVHQFHSLKLRNETDAPESFGNRKKHYIITGETFKTLCMMANTNKGKETRAYYLKTESLASTMMKYLVEMAKIDKDRSQQLLSSKEDELQLVLREKDEMKALILRNQNVPTLIPERKRPPIDIRPYIGKDVIYCSEFKPKPEELAEPELLNNPYNHYYEFGRSSDLKERIEKYDSMNYRFDNVFVYKNGFEVGLAEKHFKRLVHLYGLKLNIKIKNTNKLECFHATNDELEILYDEMYKHSNSEKEDNLELEKIQIESKERLEIEKTKTKQEMFMNLFKDGLLTFDQFEKCVSKL